MGLPRAEVFEDEFPMIQSCPALNEIRLAEEIMDLTIEVKDRAELHANRIILAAHIPSLRATLSGPLGETNSVLRWPTIPLSLATTFLQYVYTGRVEIREDNAKTLVTLARMVELLHLVDWGVAFMTRGLTLENLSAVWDFAWSLNVEALTEKCIALMKTHFEYFLPSDLLVHLPAQTLLTVLQSEDLPVSSEEQVITVIGRWVDGGACRAEDDERLQLHAPAMLKEVQWHQTTVECRDRLLEKYPTFRRSPECLWRIGWAPQTGGGGPVPSILGVVFASHSLVQMKIRRSSSLGKTGSEGGLSCVGIRICSRRNALLTWKETGRTPPTVWSENIFVVGDGVDDGRFGEVLVKEGRWRERAPLAVGRRRHAAAVVKVPTAAADGEETLIGVFGGSKCGVLVSPMSSCEVYEVRQDSWHKLPDLPEARVRPAAACLPGDSRAFVFGGWNHHDSQVLNSSCMTVRGWDTRRTTLGVRRRPQRTSGSRLPA
ncbi:hypothetical protein SprV_0200520000 [Sparganum proliferum]